MAFFEYLKLNGIALPLPDSYDMSLSAVEADSSEKQKQELHREMWSDRVL